MHYSPIIKKEQVARLHKLSLSREKKVPLTKMVHDAIELYLSLYEPGDKKGNNSKLD